MPKHYSIIFVATELFPFTRGGIGVLYGNLIKAYATPEDRILFLNASHQTLPIGEFASIYPDADVANVNTLLENTSALPRSSFSRTADWHHQSYRAWKALEHLAASGITADIVEFQDFGGLGATSLNSRDLGTFRIAPVISLRVHGPEIVLRRHSPRAPWRQHLAVMDLERCAFGRADLIVCHVPGVVQELLAALDLHDISQKIVMQRPPVGLVNGMMREVTEQKLEHSPRAVFASKLDAIKAPDVFLRGAVAAHAPKRHQSPLLLADRLEGDPSATGRLMKLVAESEDIVQWLPDMSHSVRRRILGSSAVVIPSPFEAFCLLAYEVALLGGRPVLNSQNPAFGNDSPWMDGVNCWKFDGTSQGLARTLTHSLDRKLSEPLSVWRFDEVPYWTDHQSSPTTVGSRSFTGQAARSTICVIVTNKDLGDFAEDCVHSLIDQTLRPSEVVIVDDASTLHQPDLRRALGLLSDARIPFTFVENTSRQGLAVSRNRGLERCTSDYVLFLDIDDILDASFLQRAATALDANAGIDVVVPFVSCISDYSDYLVGRQSDVLSFVGNSHYMRYVANTMSSATCLIRRSCLTGEAFDPQLPMYEDWDLWGRLADDGLTFAVDHEIGLWYRQRPESMTATGRGSIDESFALDRIRSKAVARGAGAVPALVLSDHTETPVPSPGHTEIRSSQETAQLHQLELELGRLRQVEQESAAILGRKAVRLATRLADLRLGPSARRRLRSQSVLGSGASDRQSSNSRVEGRTS